jgi:mRNA interferase RelE/StbE
LNLEIRKSFVKDVAKLPVSVKVLIEKVIQDIISKEKLSKLSSCKKLSGYKNYYRIRLGSYRTGLFYEDNTVELIRVLNRKDIYKYFP